jgi:16S rRNA U516 pseudouridylate synthase RsuA-like enzyme
MSDEQAQEAFNMSMRKFLKQVGVTSQREIERLVEDKGLAGKGKLSVRVVLTAEGTDLEHVVDGEIDLG